MERLLPGYGNTINDPAASETARALLESAPFACVIWDSGRNVVACNFETIKLFELVCQREYMNHFLELSPTHQPDGQLSRTKMISLVEEAFVTGRVVSKWTHQNLIGEMIPSEIIFVRTQLGQETFVVSHTHDLRKTKRTNSQFAISRGITSEDLLKTLIDSIPLGFLVWDGKLNLIDCSEETLNILDIDSKSALIKNFYEYSPLHQPDGSPSKDKGIAMIRKAFQTGQEIFEWLHKSAEGSIIPTEVTLVKVKIGNDCFVAGYIRDLRVLKETLELKDRLEVLAFSDSLTGIHNRHYFIEAARQITSNNTVPISIILFDLDDFKKVNDTYGHLVGDEVLIEVTSAVQGSLRPNDLFARYGGEEFILLIPESSREISVKLAERIRKTVQSTKVEYNGAEIGVTVSLGVSTQTEAREALGVLIGNADTALYDAKRSGKNITVHI